MTSPAIRSPAAEGTKLMLPGIRLPVFIGSSLEYNTFTPVTPRWRSSFRQRTDAGPADIRNLKSARIQLIARTHRGKNRHACFSASYDDIDLGRNCIDGVHYIIISFKMKLSRHRFISRQVKTTERLNETRWID